MNKIDNAYCVSSVTTIIFVEEVKIKKWGENSILKQIDDGFYICTRTVTNVY